MVAAFIETLRVAGAPPMKQPPPASTPTTRAATAPATRRASNVAPEYLVGVYYFSGWWRPQPNKYVVNGHDWRPSFPERAATLGEYVDQATLDAEIRAAYRHGVDFFQILWYPQDESRTAEPQAAHLNDAERLFRTSRVSDPLQFTIEYVNHPPFEIRDEEKWTFACRYWCEAMQHPRYLRVGGRPVFKIHSLGHFRQQNGDSDDRVRRQIATLRETARSMGLPDPLISGGIGTTGPPPASWSEPYDFLTTYMDVPNLPRKDEPYPYATLVAQAANSWKLNAVPNARPYVPYVPSGWDPRPWNDPRPSFRLPSRTEWTDALRRTRAALDAGPNLGIPLPDGRLQRALLIYAWNEFGEGGIVAPTRGDGFMKLECIRDVFGAPPDVSH